MKNLAPYVTSRISTEEEFPFALRKVVFIEDSVAACFSSDKVAAVSIWSPSQFWHDTVEWTLSVEGDEIVGFSFDPVDQKAIIAFKSGEFAEVKNGLASVVGSMETPLVGCEWSPGGDLALVLSASGKVVLISTDFDLGEDVVVGEHQMSMDDMKLAESHVSVGWGKKETQFQGRGARALSKDPTVQKEDENRKIDPVHDRLDTAISWRGDGMVVAVNTCLDSERAVRFFTQEGKLESVSEPASNLLGSCAYEPRGALIATVKSDGFLQFFERNGLMRYKVAIDRANEVKSLHWSSDSSILAIVYDDKIDLWTQKNWHWYRKQSVCGNFKNLQWHPELPKTMLAFSENEVIFFTWLFSYAHDQGLVAVIDTNEVKVTPLATAGIPPPMAFATYQLASQPTAVAVAAPNKIAVAEKNQVLELFLNLESAELQVISTFSIRDVRNIAYTPAGLVCHIGDANFICKVASPDIPLISPQAGISLLKPSHFLCGSRVFELESGMQVADFQEPCIDFVATASEAFGLTRSGKLVHSNSKVLAHGVTSIMSAPSHLLYTTLTTLRFLHFDSAHELQSNKPSELSREIERGSLLVSVMSSKVAVVLQAPRGNIETIYPRMLVLGVVRESVSRLRYNDAFEACKKHRIDMNILYDLNPELWKANTELFVKQLATESNMDLFLSSLSDIDVTKSKYVNTKTMPATEANQLASSPGKVNMLVNFILPFLQPHSQITALSIKQPPALVEALQKAFNSPELVKHLVFLSDADLLYRTALGVYKPLLALVVAQQAQMDPKEYIPFLRSRNSENHARAKFNIDLYLRRIEKAVVHLINDTEASEDEIVEFVLRHNLHQIALNLLRKFKSPATSRANSIRRILQSQAELWLSQSKYVEAGTNFELLGEFSKASDAYVKGCNWRRALALSFTSFEKRQRVIEELVEVCETNKQYKDAAHLLLHYLNDPRRALAMYCSADRYDDAVLVAASHPELKDDLKDHLRESFGLFQELLADCASQIPAQVRRLRAIRDKRREDMLGFEAMQKQMESGIVELADNLSLAGTEVSGTTNASAYTKYTDKSSVGTAASNATRRTLKNQRRQDRKKARGKKGTVYEEDYLIASVTRLIERLKSTFSELQELVTALRRCDLEIYATQLTATHEQVLSLLSQDIDEVFNIENDALVRYDESGHEYMAPRPVKPELPHPLDA